MASTAPVLADLDEVCQLVADRVSGRVSNEEVEQAVLQLLHQNRPSAAASKSSSRSTDCHTIQVQQDLEDYDDVKQEEKEELSNPIEKPRPESGSVVANPATAAKPQEPLTGELSHSLTSSPVIFDPSNYDDIPLGQQGAKMMISFGDGKCPDPAAVRTSLSAARRMLLLAIQDARRLRRRVQAEYHAAQRANKGKKSIEDISTELLYQVQLGTQNDPAIRKCPCGFGLHDLIQLFPEEMNAFLRWNQMKNEADEKRSEPKDDKETTACDDKKKKEDPLDDENNDDVMNPFQLEEGGHLRQRAQAFDARTAKMKSDWYLQFTHVRYQGSFLPKSYNQRAGGSATAESDWNQQQAGRAKEGVWAHMTFVHVRFLHWVGFHPCKQLPPPNGETTDALGFLAHDFMGRIVERALVLAENGGRTPQQEQISESDIARAVQELCPHTISTASGRPVRTQLYFGPGFEDRVELELEEMLKGGEPRQADNEDEKWQIKEELLFEQLATQPIPSERELLAHVQITTGGTGGAGAMVDVAKEQVETEERTPKKAKISIPKDDTKIESI